MRLGRLQVVEARKRYTCHLDACPFLRTIEKGTLHAHLLMWLGKADTPQHGKMFYRRAHMDCLPKLLIIIYMAKRRYRQEHPKQKGRPRGVGALSVLHPEDRERRRKLIRRRAALIRRIQAESDPSRLETMVADLEALSREVEAIQPLHDSLVRRSSEARSNIMGKVKEVTRGPARDGHRG